MRKVKPLGVRAAKRAVYNSLIGSMCVLDYDFQDQHHYPSEHDYNWDGEYIPQEIWESCVQAVMRELQKKAGWEIDD